MDKRQKELIKQDLVIGAKILRAHRSGWGPRQNPEPILYVLVKRALASGNDWIAGDDLNEDLESLHIKDGRKFNPAQFLGAEYTNLKRKRWRIHLIIKRWKPFIDRTPDYQIPQKWKLTSKFYRFVARYKFGSRKKLSNIPRYHVSSSKRKPRAKKRSPLAEDAYLRANQRELRIILRKHNKLSNAFAHWLTASGFSNISQEQNSVDIDFEREKKIYRAELKICDVGSTRAIREALGQLLEYNLYPGRTNANQWAIVLGERATSRDIEYIRRLKDKLKLPLSLGWQVPNDFKFPAGLEL